MPRPGDRDDYCPVAVLILVLPSISQVPRHVRQDANGGLPARGPRHSSPVLRTPHGANVGQPWRPRKTCEIQPKSCFHGLRFGETHGSCVTRETKRLARHDEPTRRKDLTMHAYLMMCLGLVELAMSSKRCADWDYAKREGTKSCWDRPGAGVGETELNRLFYRLGKARCGTRSSGRSPTRPRRRIGKRSRRS